jgi:phage repressor protein C with HTH and peptisase S24 domain
MEPKVPHGAYCVFRRIGAGTRQGKTVLAQYRGPADPDTGGSYTVKVYESDKSDIDGEVRGTISLRPLNPAYKPIVFTDAADEDVTVVAELLRVLDELAPP